MCNILIFGGTTEGRKLAEFCIRSKLLAYISVATDYGEQLLKNSEYLHIIKGRMSFGEISNFIGVNSIKIVVDATHPYAVEVTKNIREACEAHSVKYIRVKRKSGDFFENASYFDNVNLLVNFLNTTKGEIFITTGSKELKSFCSIESFSKRCIVRVLPSENIVEECIRLGFCRESIIAEKPPFSYEQNLSQLQKFNARYLVTKESGALGGFENKVKAALDFGSEVLIIKRPEESGYTLEETEKILLAEKCREKNVKIVGIGTDGLKSMTREGISSVENADVLIGAKRMLKPFEYLKKPTYVSYLPEKIADFIFECCYNNIAVLMSGDCGFFSGAKKLLPLIDIVKTEVVSGISSPVYFCSKLKITWSDLHFVSLHGKHENIIRNICRFEKTFFLLGGDITASDICKKLCEYDMSNVNVYIGVNLSLENERILCGTAYEFTDIQTDSLCVMIVENQGYERCVRSCIPDEEFIRGKVPMTKAEVRSVCVSKLAVGDNDICWDIGSGTGSVAVEMALRCIGGAVHAVERNAGAAELIDKNGHKFRCDNIKITVGDAETAVKDLPAPDCVFVGGSGGELEKIIETAFEKNPKVRIIVTAVSLETLSESIRIFDKTGIDSDVMQIAVTHTRKVGSHTMLKAENPIYIVTGGNK